MIISLTFVRSLRIICMLNMIYELQLSRKPKCYKYGILVDRAKNKVTVIGVLLKKECKFFLFDLSMWSTLSIDRNDYFSASTYSQVSNINLNWPEKYQINISRAHYGLYIIQMDLKTIKTVQVEVLWPMLKTTKHLTITNVAKYHR